MLHAAANALKESALNSGMLQLGAAAGLRALSTMSTDLKSVLAEKIPVEQVGF